MFTRECPPTGFEPLLWGDMTAGCKHRPSALRLTLICAIIFPGKLVENPAALIFLAEQASQRGATA